MLGQRTQRRARELVAAVALFAVSGCNAVLGITLLTDDGTGGADAGADASLGDASAAAPLDGSDHGDSGTVASHDAATFDGAEGNDAPLEAAADSAGSPLLLVNEIQTGGEAGATDEFVEIYNPNPASVSLAGWSLRYLSATATATSMPELYWTAQPSDSIAANGYVVVGGMTYAGPVIGRTTSGGMSAVGGAIGLFDPAAVRIDSVAYGTATTANPEAEGAPCAAPAAEQSAYRHPNGQDTNSNAADFALGTPTPGAANP